MSAPIEVRALLADMIAVVGVRSREPEPAPLPAGLETITALRILETPRFGELRRRMERLLDGAPRAEESHADAMCREVEFLAQLAEDGRAREQARRTTADLNWRYRRVRSSLHWREASADALHRLGPMDKRALQRAADKKARNLAQATTGGNSRARHGSR
jgi:hypothetical protein